MNWPIIMCIVLMSSNLCCKENMQQATDATTQNILQVSTFTLDEARRTFKNYVYYLVEINNLPRSMEDQQKDIEKADIEMLKYSTGPKDDSLVPVKKIQTIKRNYRTYLKTQYPKHFQAATTKDGYLTRQLAQQRIRKAAQERLNKYKHDPKIIKMAWKQLKQEYVDRQLRIKVFFDDFGIPVVLPSDIDLLIDKMTRTIDKQYSYRPSPQLIQAQQQVNIEPIPIARSYKRREARRRR
jgi:hypothetical protein